ncbi:MAG: C25 family cysteine peptidase [Cyclobacteriaceae bacterium]|nr:C25 family cysteine peptidase [Cyclobacteriaceae bacterium]
MRFLKGLILSGLCGYHFLAQAQFGNEWIQFNQFYFKVAVARDGVHRITYTDLLNAGFPVGAIDPRRLQLFHRGIEQSIFVAGQNDAIFNPEDYIEFFGRRNDGKPDAELYRPATSQPHSYYNLFNDTTWYFLTYNLLQPGKRINQTWEVNVGGLPAETSHNSEALRVLTDQYSTGKTYGPAPNNFIQQTFFDTGEGWTGIMLRQNEQVDYVLENINRTVVADGLPQLEVQVVGRAEVFNRVEIYVGPNPSTLRLWTTQDFSGYTPVTFNQPVNWADIGGDGRMTVRIRALSAGTGAARLSANYIRLTWPQSFNASGFAEKLYRLRPKAGGKSYVEFSGVASGSRLWDVTNTADITWYDPPTPSSPLHPVISQTTESRSLYLFSVVHPVSQIKRITFRNIQPALHNYIIISHPLLRKPSGSYADPVTAYAAYRASAQGGGYDTLVVNIQQLYDQFNYGETSPLAIFRFMKFLCNTHVPKYLFIIGKGLDPSWDYFRRPNATEFTVHKNLVPSAGMPASDMLFTIGLAGTTHEPAVPTGRISATSPQQVAAYLDKVKEMEAQPYDALWRKKIVHLSGGLNPLEIFLFRTILEQYGVTAGGPYLGGAVKAQAKNTTQVGELINIAEEVNSGVNLITFFGHSSPTTNDFEVGFVSDPLLGYNNPGKYPMFLINGCNAADFFTTSLRWGEDWVLAASKGAVGFMAHTSFGYTSTLRKYSDLFYQLAYADSSFIRRGVGDIQKELARRYMLTETPQEIHLTQVSQMLLLGDPAVKVFGAPAPDYEVNENTLIAEAANGEALTAFTEEVALHFIVRNFGQARPQPLHVRVVRTFADNSTETYDSLFAPVYYADTLTFIIPQQRNKAGGNNSFRIELDPDNLIAELNEDNNRATINVFIPSNATRNIFPQNYAMVNTAEVRLTFSASDILAPARTFEMEIDTAYTFSSTYRKQFEVTGTLAEKLFTLLADDSVTYYWRTRLKNPLPGESNEWTTSSFTYIASSPGGWGQFQFGQMLSNSLIGLVPDEPLRLHRFESKTIPVEIRTYGSAHPAPHTSVSVKINNSEYNPSTFNTVCRNNTINLIAFDKNSTIPYTAVEFNPFDGRACGRRPQVINSFRPAELITGLGNDIFQYMNNVPDGDSVVVFSIGDAGYAAWPPAALIQFERIGISSAQINMLQPGEPVVFFGKKGAVPGSALMYRPAASPANAQELSVSKTISGGFSAGTMTSTLIGPAQQWQQLFIRARTTEVPVTDNYYFDVMGVDLQGNESLLLSGLAANTDLSSVDAAAYPYLRVVYHAADAVNLTPPQLVHWAVTYESVAEGIITFAGPQTPVPLREGENWSGTFGFKNISGKEFSDSLTVQVTLKNNSLLRMETRTQRIAPPAPGQTTAFTLNVNTTGWAGANDLKVFVNPKLVPEQIYDNNVAELFGYLQVQRDVLNPVLEITFDGRKLRNGDFVSPNPVIRLRVYDENPFIRKTTPDGVRMFLTYPGESTPTEINFSRDDVVWYPATDTSDFIVLFTPQSLPEGNYTLRAEVRDASGNPAGAEPYVITFQVRYTGGVVLRGPAPNPFTERVIFTLIISGEAPPDRAVIEIINMRGQKIRQLEFTRLVIGTNELMWDAGTGSNPEAGLYLYRLRVFQNGSELPVQPENDSSFKSGFGKLLKVN